MLISKKKKGRHQLGEEAGAESLLTTHAQVAGNQSALGLLKHL